LGCRQSDFQLYPLSNSPNKNGGGDNLLIDFLYYTANADTFTAYASLKSRARNFLPSIVTGV
jgi:hypothetical protein